MKKYHILFKTDSNKHMSTGKNYESKLGDGKEESDHMMYCILGWERDYPLEKYPNREFLMICSSSLLGLCIKN